jgi:tRNA-2-methylthio-N6-dimethylallyladenosine synthase
MPALITDLDILALPLLQPNAESGSEQVIEPAARALQAPGPVKPGNKLLYLESFGCQMNYSDSEIVASILSEHGYSVSDEPTTADLILLNTCAIRENAEQKIRYRLKHLNGMKSRKPGMLIGVLGCMAERLKTKLLDQEQMVDMVVGPDAYRTLPALIEEAESGQKAVNVFLSREETYADISPLRLSSNGVSAYISIMRGCDNMCSFCVVPFTRGRERSRDLHTIHAEATDLFSRGYREVTLLGQNVDSYRYLDPSTGTTLHFEHLLEAIALISPLLRVRFSTSHPKDITNGLLHTMARHTNICNYIHLPAQSGNSNVLERMNRTYTREWYLDRIAAIKNILGPDSAISTDIITGFCGETEDEHTDTLTLMQAVGYHYAYMFAYSERPGTPAAKKYSDDIPEQVKKRRLNEVIALQSSLSAIRNKETIGKTYSILVEGPSRKGNGQLCGRNDANAMVVFDGPATLLPGSYCHVLVTASTSATLFGTLLS